MSDSVNTPIQRVDVVVPELEPGVRWQPRVGDETLDLLKAVTELHGLEAEAGPRLSDEAVAVLERCSPPEVPTGTETGLVVGHVQSGKTMSFTTVAALARDNGYAIVILITGTSIPLSLQSLERLREDLRLATRSDRQWLHFHNPDRRTAFHRVNDALADWRDPDVPNGERQTVLITAMKHHGRLANLIDLLRDLQLDGLPVLVIDDEADQAGLNNLTRQGQESTTYRRLTELRQLLLHHTYLEYTATPQAPLLINLIDVLSPRFAEVLTPGPEYVGGREFFVERQDLIRIIPPAEIPTRAQALHEPPPTLLDAMRIFVLGVAAGVHLDSGRGNRSMMVHPSRETMRHGEYTRWVRDAKQQWETVLALDEADPDRREFVEELRESHQELRRTVRDLPDFNVLLSIVRRSIRRIQVTEVNAAAGRTPQIDWTAAYGHILVGGQAMDRGFTVRGLTVTYMPRGVGVGNADTMWQRARFLGYHRRYLDYCRIYLEQQILAAYRAYVQHEEDIRDRLIAHSRTGRPLSDWKRAFFLELALQPTRRSVLGLDYMQSVVRNSWFYPDAPHESEEAVEDNRRILSAFESRLQFHPDSGHHERLGAQRHHVSDSVPLQQAYEELLIQFRMTRPRDSQRYTGVLLQVREYLDRNPGTTCAVYRMSPDYPQARQRKVNDADEIRQLFQGAYPVDPPEARGTVYPGDREIRAANGITIQIHRLDVIRDGGTVRDVPVLAVWLPSDAAYPWLVQDEH
jgi:hypothetical protein